MNRIAVFVSVLMTVLSCKAQDLTQEYSSHRVYKSLKKALKYKDDVVVLDLSNKGLDAVPEEIAQFKNLKFLNLDGNNITVFPDNFWSLSNLEELRISRNGLRSIPTEIGTLRSLKRLFLSRNNLGVLPQTITQLKNLRTLDLSFNRLAERDVLFIKEAIRNCFVLVYVEM